MRKYQKVLVVSLAVSMGATGVASVPAFADASTVSPPIHNYSNHFTDSDGDDLEMVDNSGNVPAPGPGQAYYKMATGPGVDWAKELRLGAADNGDVDKGTLRLDGEGQESLSSLLFTDSDAPGQDVLRVRKAKRWGIMTEVGILDKEELANLCPTRSCTVRWNTQ